MATTGPTSGIRFSGLASGIDTDSIVTKLMQLERIPVQRLQTRLLSRVYSGGILLLHQGVPDTVRVLPAAWQVLRRHGYTVTRVRDLLPVPEGAWEPPGSLRR